MHRSPSIVNDANRIMVGLKVPKILGGCVLDDRHLPKSWDRWQDLMAYVIWQASPEVHRAMVFARRLLVKDTLALVDFLLECCALPFKWIPYDDNLDPSEVRQSVLLFFRLWLELAFRDFSGDALTHLLDGLKGLVSPMELNKFKLLGLRRVNFQRLEVGSEEPVEELPAEELSRRGALGATELAEGLVVVDRMLYLELTGEALLEGSDESVHRHFNRVCFGLASRLLSLPSRADQLGEMTVLIETAANCYNHSDLMGAMAVTAALTCHDVARLRLTEELPEVQQVTLLRLEEMMTGANNYQMLRSAERTRFEAALPTVPFVPMHLRDFITIKENSGRQTFEQLFVQGSVAADLLLQQRHVSIPPEEQLNAPVVHYWLTLPYLAEEKRALLSDVHRERLQGLSGRRRLSTRLNMKKSLLHDKPSKRPLTSFHRKHAKPLSPRSAPMLSSMERRREVILSDDDELDEEELSDETPRLRRQMESRDDLESVTITHTMSADMMRAMLEEEVHGKLSPKVLSSSIRRESRGSELSEGDLTEDMMELSVSEEGSEAALSDTVVWTAAQKRWWTTMQLQLSDGAIQGALAAAAEGRSQRKKAEKRLTYLANYFRRRKRPIMAVSGAMTQLVVEEQVLYYDPLHLRDAADRAVLLMQPGRYVPAAVPAVEVVDLLMAFAQWMYATEPIYTFVADMRNWGAANFSVSYAKNWFFAMQSLPLPIAQFVLVSPQPFFQKAFKLFSPFLDPTFRAKFHFVQMAEIAAVFSAEHGAPDLFAGPLVLNYKVCMATLKMRLDGLKLQEHSYWRAWMDPSSHCLHCTKPVDRVNCLCSECRSLCCLACLRMVRLASLGEKKARPLCPDCLIQQKTRIAQLNSIPSATDL